MEKKNFEERSDLWSKIGLRASFGLMALDIAKQTPKLIILTADVSTSAGLDRFKREYPSKFLDVGIAEQNMIGVAAGLSSENYKVITTTFSPFQTLRCCEQIKINLAYMNQNVVMVGLASGLTLGTLGYTHCSIEDISVMRSFPNMTILVPSDGLELFKILQSSLKNKGPVYIRLTGGNNLKKIYNKDFNFKIGKSITLKKGKKLTIFCNGMMVAECLEATKLLNKINIFPEIINMPTVKPIDKKQIIKSCLKSKLLISVEEHSIIGGLGSAIAEVKSNLTNSPKLIMLGIKDEYDKGGEYKYLLNKHSLTSKKIFNIIKKEYAKI
jgi:transketolase